MKCDGNQDEITNNNKTSQKKGEGLKGEKIRVGKRGQKVLGKVRDVHAVTGFALHDLWFVLVFPLSACRDDDGSFIQSDNELPHAMPLVRGRTRFGSVPVPDSEAECVCVF